MNEMNPQMKIKYPLPFTKPWGAPSSLPGKFGCRDDIFLSGRSEKTSLHHETDRICRRHPRPPQTRQAKRVIGQQEERVMLSFLCLDFNSALGSFILSKVKFTFSILNSPQHFSFFSTPGFVWIYRSVCCMPSIHS